MYRGGSFTRFDERRPRDEALRLAQLFAPGTGQFREIGIAPLNAEGLCPLPLSVPERHHVYRKAHRQLGPHGRIERSEEHTSELQSLMRISYAVFCLKKNIAINRHQVTHAKLTTHQDHTY